MCRIAFACSLIALASGPSLATDRHGRSANSPEMGYTKTAAAHTASSQDAVVVTAPTLAAWSAKFSQTLSDAMRDPRSYGNEPSPEGWARVRFSCSDSGAPTGVELVQSSGDRRIDRAALEAVRRIKTMHPLAAGIKHDQRYVAELAFANSSDTLEHQLQSLRKRPMPRAGLGAAREITLLASPGRVGG